MAEWKLVERGDMNYYQVDVTGVIMKYSTRKGNALFLKEFKPLLQKQVHGKRINNVDTNRPQSGDGLTSGRDKINLGIKIADCLPVFLFNDRQICAIHCGWRGIAEGIVDAAKGLIKNYQYALGAAIGPCCYEIKSDVKERFSARAPVSIQERKGRSYLDLKTAVKTILGADKLIADLAMCTKCRNDIFYSYRAGDTDQRNYALICRK